MVYIDISFDQERDERYSSPAQFNNYYRDKQFVIVCGSLT